MSSLIEGNKQKWHSHNAQPTKPLNKMSKNQLNYLKDA